MPRPQYQYQPPPAAPVTYVRDTIVARGREYCVAVWQYDGYWEVVLWDLGVAEPQYETVLGTPKRRVGPFEKTDALDLMAETLAQLFMGADPVEVMPEAIDELDLFELNVPAST